MRSIHDGTCDRLDSNVAGDKFQSCFKAEPVAQRDVPTSAKSFDSAHGQAAYANDNNFRTKRRTAVGG